MILIQEEQLRNIRTTLVNALDTLWEIGGYTLGEKIFEDMDQIKDAREEIKKIDELLKIGN